MVVMMLIFLPENPGVSIQSADEIAETPEIQSNKHDDAFKIPQDILHILPKMK
jgi:hypothetical protein